MGSPKTSRHYKNGFVPSAAYKKGNIPYMAGKKHAKKSIDKMRVSHIGLLSGSKHPMWGKHPVPWNKDMKGIYKHAPPSQKTKDKISKGNLGKPKSKEHIAALCIAQQKRFTDPKERLRMKQIRSEQKLPTYDSKPELKLQNQLKNLGYTFETDYRKLLGRPDIYIEEKKLCIFADGCYHHACHECKLQEGKFNPQAVRAKKQWHTDFRVKHELELEGYQVIRLWEHDINKPQFDVANVLG